jgi:hypothetical protein
MNKTQTNLQYVNRNNKPDTAFAIAIKRQQASRTIKRALRASAYATLKVYTRVYDDINKTNYYETMYPKPEIVISKQRNLLGQFTR